MTERNGYTEEEWRQKQTQETMTYVGAGVATIGFVGAVVFWLAGDGGGQGAGLEPPPEPQRRRHRVAPWLSPEGGGLGVQGRF